MLLIFGHGYTGAALLREAGADAAATSRIPRDGLIAFADAAGAIARATHIVVTVPPGETCPVLATHGDAIRAARSLRHICYYSTTGVYGDRAGGWVDEHTVPAPGSDRSRRRLAAEQAWATFAPRIAVDLFRLAGIYGPGRSALDEVRAGTARRILAPGHCFGRIHRDDIVGATLAAFAHPPAGLRVLHGNDNEPAESAAVIAEAARLLAAPVPPAIPFEQAWQAMSPMARSFWSESRRVRSALTQEWLGRPWRYPTYREGLRAILEAGG